MDFIGWEPNERTLWLLEVKDYTTNRREKSLNIDDEIATKVRDTLAFLLGASAMAAPDSAKTDAFATSCLPPKKIRVVLHLEQPCKPSKLFPRIKNIADMTQLLRRKLRCIDAHPKVVSLIHPATLPWKAEWCP